MRSIGSLFLNLRVNATQYNAGLNQAGQAATNAANQINNALAQTNQGFNILARNARMAQFAVTNLGFQLNDVVSGLVSGQNPFQIMAQQGGQIIQAFVQGGGVIPVLRATGTALRALATPAMGVTLGLGTVAVGLGVLIDRALTGQQSVRQFGVMLRALGSEGTTTADEMEAAAKRLRDVGLSASDARAALRTAARSGLDRGAGERLVRIGQNLIPALGEDALKTFLDAAAGGVEPLGKLAVQLGLVTRGEVEVAREAAKTGNQFAILERWITLIEQHTKGMHKDAMSPLAKMFDTLGENFQKMLDAMANSKAIQLVVNGLNNMAIALTNLFNLTPPDWFTSMFSPHPTDSPVVTGKDVPIPKVGSTGGTAIDMDALVKAIIKVESNGNPRAVSPAGAKGLMQLMPGTASDMGVTDPFDPVQNVAGGTKYLKQLLAKYNGDVELALMAYNWGPGKLDKALKAGSTIPTGVRGYASTVMGKAGIAPGTYAAPDGTGTGTGTPSTYETERKAEADAYAKRKEIEFKELSREAGSRLFETGYTAAAYGKGTAAGRFADVEAQGAQETERRFGYGTLNERQIAQRDAQGRERIKQLNDQRMADQRKLFAVQSAADKDQEEALTKQTSLLGQSSEEIERQVGLLKIRQEAEAAGLALTDESVKAREAEFNKLQDTTNLLGRQQHLLGLVNEYGGVLEKTVGGALDSIADHTFKLSKLFQGLLLDLGKLLASQAMKALLYGETGTGGGILGSLFGTLFKGGVTAAGGVFGSQGPLFGNAADASIAAGGPPLALPANAVGGAFVVPGSGAIDSKVVSFRASPGEMVSINNGIGGNGGGRGEVIHVQLNPSEGWVAGVADQQIRTRSGAIVRVAVTQSQALTRRSFGSMASESQARTA